jgi:hypothetical protein
MSQKSPGGGLPPLNKRWSWFRPLKPIKRSVRPAVEELEKRVVFAINAFLPQRLAPVNGVAAEGQTDQLFRPVTTNILPELNLQSASVALSGSFLLTDGGMYSLSVQESGPDGSGSFSFREGGLVGFSITESGGFNGSTFSFDCVVLSEENELAWTFLQFDSSGHTVHDTSGSYIFPVTTSAVDPLFWVGFNWADATAEISSLNTLGLDGLSATSVSVSESYAGEGYSFTLTGTETLTGTGSQPLMDSPTQPGQESYTETVTAAFTYTNSGDDNFTLTEAGGYANGSFAFNCVAYEEESSSGSYSGPGAGPPGDGTWVPSPARLAPPATSASPSPLRSLTLGAAPAWKVARSRSPTAIRASRTAAATVSSSASWTPSVTVSGEEAVTPWTRAAVSAAAASV